MTIIEIFSIPNRKYLSLRNNFFGKWHKSASCEENILIKLSVDVQDLTKTCHPERSEGSSMEREDSSLRSE